MIPLSIYFYLILVISDPLTGLFCDSPSPDVSDLVEKVRIARALAAFGIHSSSATSHISGFGPNETAARLHRRLHAGIDRIRRLPEMTSDAPEQLAKATQCPCEACVEANAKHRPHPTRRYRPS